MIFLIACAGVVDLAILFRSWPAPATAMPVARVVQDCIYLFIVIFLRFFYHACSVFVFGVYFKVPQKKEMPAALLKHSTR